jgi:MoaA/NifB/PqqE/SkfB family radical SAM enzyme
LVKEVRGKVFRMTYSGRGEPTLHPDIFKMIRFAHDSGLKTMMNSNGQLLDDDEVIMELLSSGLDSLHLSLDGSTQDTYE